MSSIEVSLLASNYKMETDAERTFRRLQRPPPPPPPSQQISSPLIEQTVLPSELETSPLSAETPTHPVEDRKKNHPSLLSEFNRLFDKFDYESAREEILNRQMMDSNFTTVLWRIFLHCIPRDSNQWNEMIDTTRNNYEKLVNEYKIDPYKMSDDNGKTHLNHPLSQDENSLWAQYFADEELKATITIDVRRTHPDITYFRNPRTIDLQLRILFAHSRHHQKTTPYRQGMHEILGVIVYAIYSESLKVNDYLESNELMKKLYDPQYLEHDAYAIFEKMMDHLRQFYALTTKNSVIRKSVIVNDKLKQIPFERLNDVYIRTNDTVTRMNSIFERLRHYDRLLHCKLEELNIEPTVYGIRWLRLLFGREVPFTSIPSLWTVIFCFDEHFGFVDYFFIALLIAVGRIIRRQGEIEHNACLELLMKQNVITKVEPVIRKALTLTGRELPSVAEEEPIIPSIQQTDGTRQNPIKNDRENITRSKELQRVRIPPAPQPRLNRPNITDARKSTSPPQPTLPDNSLDSLKRSSSNTIPFTSPSYTSDPVPSNIPTAAEMDLWSGKITRQRYDENIRLQKSCAQYMYKFIERLQNKVCELQAPNEDELHIQLSGLKQIANVLDGKLTFDGDSLQSLVNYGCKDKTIGNNSSDTG